MHNIRSTKTISTLSVLSPAEWKQLKTFLDSGLGGPSALALKLYRYLSVYFPFTTNKGLDREKVYEALFGNGNFDDKKLRYALTDLYQHACGFLKYKALDSDVGESRFLLGTLLAQRGADKAYLSLYPTDDIDLTVDAYENAEHYLNRHRLSFIHMNHYLPRQKRDQSNPVEMVSRNLDIYFIAKKLQLLCEIINVQNVKAVNYEFLMRDEIVSLVETGQFNNIPIIAVYYRIYKTLTEPDRDDHFKDLKTLLIEYGSRFEKEELRDMYQYVMNYCIKKINQGVTEYISVLFEIYRTVLERKVIYSGNYLSQWDFKNIVVIGIRAGQQNWVLSFIEKFSNDLLPGERSNAYTYNLAYYYFSIGNYHRSLNLLRQVEFTDLYYQLDMRAILLKCYFETDEQETLFYHVAAFRVFLNRNRLISEYQRTIYRNLLKYTTQLVRANGNKRKITVIKNEIESVKQIADLNWLRKKMEEV